MKVPKPTIVRWASPTENGDIEMKVVRISRFPEPVVRINLQKDIYVPLEEIKRMHTFLGRYIRACEAG